MAELTSDEVNALIYSYFKDEGLELSANALRYETGLEPPPGGAAAAESGHSELVRVLLRGYESIALESLVSAATPAPSLDFGLAETARAGGGRLVCALDVAGVAVVVVAGEQLAAYAVGGDGAAETLLGLRGVTCLYPMRGGVLLGQEDGSVALLALDTQPPSLYPPQSAGAAVRMARPNFSGSVYACACADSFATWPAAGTETVQSTQLEDVACVEWLSDDTLAVAHGADVAVYTLGVAHALKTELRRHTLRVARLAFDADSQTLFSASVDGVYCAWRAGAAEPARAVKAHADAITDLSLINGDVLTAGADGLVKLWDAAGALLAQHDVGAAVRRCSVSGARVAVLAERSVVVLELEPSARAFKLVARRAGPAADIALLGERLVVTGERTGVYALES